MDNNGLNQNNQVGNNTPVTPGNYGMPMGTPVPVNQVQPQPMVSPNVQVNQAPIGAPTVPLNNGIQQDTVNYVGQNVNTTPVAGQNLNAPVNQTYIQNQHQMPLNPQMGLYNQYQVPNQQNAQYQK